MAMELLFENQTQMDEAVIHHIIEKNFKRDKKTRLYHILTLVVAIITAAAAIYFGRIGILYRQFTPVICAIVLIVVCFYSFSIFFKNTPKKLIKSYQNSYNKDLLIPRKIKVYKNVMFQSAGKSHGEYRLYQFSDIESWDHYFLLKFEKSYVVIDKNGFTTGTPEEFEKFMNEKILKNF